MRILFVVNKLIFGGAETQLIALSAELSRRGHDVAIYTLQRDNPRLGEVASTGVQVIEDQKRQKLDLALLWRLRRFIRDYRPDIVQGILVDGNLHARLAAAGTGVPALNSERNDNYQWPLQHRIGVWLTRGLAAGLVANSHAGARFAQQRFKLPDANVHVVWNGIDPTAVERRASAAVDPRVEFFGRSDIKVACLVGMIRPAKDYHLALAVAERLHAVDGSWRVLFVGDSNPQTDHYKSTVMTAAKGLVDRGLVSFAGLRKDVPAIVRHANVLFSTSIHEGFPNVVLEAMAVGTPVICTEFSDIRRILPCDWQVVGARDAAALSAAIVRADNERNDIAERQLNWVREHGTISRAADRLEATFRLYVRAAPVDRIASAQVARS
jgi:glycosyltransferase involved in cell wall biosynthesis